MSSSRVHDDLDRRAAHRARQQCRFEHEVAFRLSAKAAAEQRDVDRHVLAFEAEFLGQLLLRVAGALHRRPSLAFAVGDAHRGGRRLHRRMREVRDVIFGRDRLRRRGQRLVGVAVVAHDLARLARGLLELALVGGRIVAAVRPVVPVHDQRLAPLDRRPGVGGDHRDAARPAGISLAAGCPR